MRQFLTFILVFGFFSNVFAQNNFWTAVKPESVTLPAGAERKIKPLQFNTFQLDYVTLKTTLSQAPMEFTAAAREAPVVLSLPLADGSMQTFQVWESPVMAPELAAKFPAIRTFAGKAADGSGLTVRLGVDYKGFHAYIFDLQGKIQSLRPYAEGDDKVYMTYRVEDLSAEPSSFLCGTEDSDEITKQIGAAAERGSGLVTLKKYRLAISTTGEYAQFHGGTTSSVMSAITQAVNFIVAIQERDWAVRLELIPNNDTLIYFDPDTDPFMGPLIPNWIGDNPAAINSRVGANSYDIGHLFSRVVSNPGGTYVAGQAALASVCDFPAKAVAGSSLPSPIGEEYYLIVAHEMGHQFSATHSWNYCLAAADQRTGSTAYEPGGGSTIMGYTVCGDDNITGGRDGYFHSASIEQAMEFITQGGGNTCGEAIVTDNNAPEVSIPLTNGFFIPISTPFVLTANATDADGDELTYCWEEFDLGVEIPLGQANGTSPLFRSYPPDDDPSRTFPRLFSIVFNQSNPAELLPDYSRFLNFRCTVRDNHPGAGGVSWAEVQFRSTSQAGPFVVTYPNASSVTWYSGEYQTIEWDVANTDKAPVNCQTVNILLSVNNGLAYQVTLASGVPNNGKYCVKLPDNVTSSNARIRVEAADNIFFDLSNAGFKILPPAAPSFSLCAESLVELACAPTAFTSQISTGGIGGFDAPITLSAVGLPAGATATFSPNPVAPGSTSTMTINFSNSVLENEYDVTVTGTSDTLSTGAVITFTVVQNDFSALALQTPANGAQSVDIGPWLYWNGVVGADKYEVQVASSPSFEASTILVSNANVMTDSFKVSPLGEGKVCYWRVRPVNECSNEAWTEPFVFVTKSQNCGTLVATDLPKNISANGTPTVESKITVSGTGILVEDVNVKKVQGNHTFMQDLEVRLISPAGTNVLLFKDKCGGYNGNFNMGFDDSANGPFACPPPQNGTIVKPTELLGAFNNQNSAGVWTLRVKDNVISSGGTLSAFELELCSSVSLNPPFIVNNNPLQLPGGSNAVIGDDLLKVEDANNSAGQLVFTLITVPKFGDLRITGSPMKAGEQFTQADISNGLLRYYDYGTNASGDDFRFSVTDGEGGLVAGTFSIQASVGTKEPLGNIAFALAPNPASESVRLFVSQPLDADSRVTLLNLAGQQVQTWNLASGATSLLLNLTDLPKGVYFVSVENEKGKGVKKVVVQ